VARPEHTDMAQVRGKSLRRELTVSEARVWGAIKGRRLGVRFRRQVPMGPWIVDFACLDPRLVIEVDDESHHWKDERARTRYLVGEGFAVVRFWNEEVAREFDGVVETIKCWVRALQRGEEPRG
jgi:very-short-patch-repair endonuclease